MNIHPDLTFSTTHTLTQSDFDRFAALTGDDNPIHVDPIFAAQTRFGKTVAHGMFLYSRVCAALGALFPGMTQLTQELMFPTPTFAGEPTEFQLVVTETDPARGLVDVRTTVTSPRGEIGLQGRALIALPDGEQRFVRAASPREDALSAPTLPGLSLGQRASAARAFTSADLTEYADLTGDTNPVYQTRLPGGLLGGMFSDLLGTKLPGRGTNWLKQKLHFPHPAYPGEFITASVEIVRLRLEKDLVNLRTVCANPMGTVVCEGEALVFVRDLETK